MCTRRFALTKQAWHIVSMPAGIFNNYTLTYNFDVKAICASLAYSVRSAQRRMKCGSVLAASPTTKSKSGNMEVGI